MLLPIASFIVLAAGMGMMLAEAMRQRDSPRVKTGLILLALGILLAVVGAAVG